MNIRCLHFDMKSMIPKADYLLSFVEKLAALHYNALLIEFEDKFPFEAFPAATHPATYTKDDFRRLNAKCRELGITVIPLLQSVGHLDYFLKHPEYRDLREGDGATSYQWCLSDPRVFEVWRTMAREILEVFPDCEYFHIGADEVQLKHSCSKCGEADYFSLYFNHVSRCTDFLAEQKKHVLIWDDMFRTRDLKPLEPLLKKVIPCVWQYREVDENHVRRMAELGIELWGASCIQANYRYRGMGPQEPKRRNVDDWAVMNEKYALNGHIGTIWGRIQCQLPIESTLPQSMYMIAYLAETLQHGKIRDRKAFHVKLAKEFFDSDSLDVGGIADHFCYDPDQVSKLLNAHPGEVRKNRDILEIWNLFNEIDVLYRYIDMCFSSNEALLPLYRAGMVPDEMTNNWLDGVRITAERTEALKERLRTELGRYFPAVMLEEFLGERFLAMLEQNQRWGNVIADAKKHKKI